MGRFSKIHTKGRKNSQSIIGILWLFFIICGDDIIFDVARSFLCKGLTNFFDLIKVCNHKT